MKNILVVFMITVFSIANHIPNTQVKLYVDNPTNEEISIIIDSTTKMTIKPFSYDSVSLESGNHTVQYEDISTSFILEKNGSILNPTRSNYIIEEVSYKHDSKTNRISYDFHDTESDRTPRIPYDTIYVSRYVIHGNIKLIKGNLLIPKEWDYDIVNPLSIQTNKLLDTIIHATVKIYRVSDRFEYWYYNTPGI